MILKVKIISIFSMLVFFLIFYVFSLNVSAEIFVHDIVLLKNEETLLKAETRGKFSHKGGELVEFFIDGKTIGRTLSGGDGFAFKQFSSKKTGLLKVSVKSSAEEASGVLLVLNKGSKIVITDFEGGLIEGELLKKKPRDGSQNAIKEINKRYPVVVLQTGMLSKKAIRDLLRKYEYMDLPIVAWGGGDIFAELVQKGIIIKAVIGSDALINSASKYKPLSFSFTAKEGALSVKKWEEIKKRLLKK